jgi:hypothetical protein
MLWSVRCRCLNCPGGDGPEATVYLSRAEETNVSDRWLHGWGLASVGLGGASLVVPLYVVELGGRRRSGCSPWPPRRWVPRGARRRAPARVPGGSSPLARSRAIRSGPPRPPVGSDALRGATRFGVRGAGFPFAPARADPRGLHPRRFVRRFTPALALYFAAVCLLFAGFGAFFAPLPAYLAGAGFGSDAAFGLYLALNVGAAAAFGGGRLAAIGYTVAFAAAGLVLVGVGVVLVLRWRLVTGGARGPPTGALDDRTG